MDVKPPDRLEWRFIPYQALPVRTLLLALVVLAVGLVLVANLGVSLPAFVLLVLFTWSLRLALFATSYSVDGEGVRRTNLGRRQHFRSDMIRRVVPVPGAVFVSQHRRPSRLDRFQGWLIPLPEQDKEQIISYLQGICSLDQEEGE